MFNKILLATDGSADSMRAAEKALYIAQGRPEAKVDVVYVVDCPTSKADVLENWNAGDVNTKRKEKLRLIEDKAKEAGVVYDIKILHGDPGPTIVDYANKNNYDVVVLGSRGLNSLQEMILGSVSHKVAKRAKCSVLIVK